MRNVDVDGDTLYRDIRRVDGILHFFPWTWAYGHVDAFHSFHFAINARRNTFARRKNVKPPGSVGFQNRFPATSLPFAPIPYLPEFVLRLPKIRRFSLNFAVMFNFVSGAQEVFTGRENQANVKKFPNSIRFQQLVP